MPWARAVLRLLDGLEGALLSVGEWARARPKSALLAAAVASRLFFISFAVAWDAAIADHDAAGVAHFVEDQAGALATFTRWDAAHYLNIARRGYAEDMELAFLPGLPALLRACADRLERGLGLVGMRLPDGAHLIVAGVAMNSVAAVAACLALYELSCAVLQSEAQALASALLFCVNPATPFFVAIYTESLFAALTFLGLTFLHAGAAAGRRGSVARECLSSALAAACFLGASCLRANGLLNGGFALFQLLRMAAVRGRWRAASAAVGRPARALCLLAVLSAACAPFAYFQAAARAAVCTQPCGPARAGAGAGAGAPAAIFAGLLDAALLRCSDALRGGEDVERPRWCEVGAPSPYAYVQRRYWDVGFLRRWRLRQLPNFLLAAPMLVLLCVALRRFGAATSPGLRKALADSAGSGSGGSFARRAAAAARFLLAKGGPPAGSALLRPPLLPYYGHAAVLGAMALFVAHPQILTRLACSSSPLVYWLLADAIVDGGRPANERLIRYALHYFALFNVVGFALHYNFFPWT